jgi:hypothetical protein
MLNEGSRGRVQRLDVRGSKNPQRERDPRDKEELTFTVTGKCKRNGDKDLLTELPKNTQFGMGQVVTTNNTYIKILNHSPIDPSSLLSRFIDVRWRPE